MHRWPLAVLLAGSVVFTPDVHAAERAPARQQSPGLLQRAGHAMRGLAQKLRHHPRAEPSTEPQVNGLRRFKIQAAATVVGRDARGVPSFLKEHLSNYLCKQDTCVLTSMLRKFHPDRPASDYGILQALFEQRGASRGESRQQLMLQKRYGINTIVTQDGNPGMWPGSTSPKIVRSALSKESLEPRIQTYLRLYLLDHSSGSFH